MPVDSLRTHKFFVPPKKRSPACKNRIGGPRLHSRVALHRRPSHHTCSPLRNEPPMMTPRPEHANRPRSSAELESLSRGDAIRDIRRLETKLETMREQSTPPAPHALLAEVTHDLRKPLIRMVKLAARRSEASIGKPEKKYAQIIEQSRRQLARPVEAILSCHARRPVLCSRVRAPQRPRPDRACVSLRGIARRYQRTRIHTYRRLHRRAVVRVPARRRCLKPRPELPYECH